MGSQGGGGFMKEVLFELGKISAGRDGEQEGDLFPYFHEQRYGSIKMQGTF